MAEYIEREALLNKTYDIPTATGTKRVVMYDDVVLAPAADVAPVVHGHWILEREPNGKPYCFHCSACDKEFRRINIYTTYNYCPDCGAKMDIDKEV